MNKKKIIKRINDLGVDGLRLALMKIANGDTLEQAIQKAEENELRVRQYLKESEEQSKLRAQTVI